MGVHRNEFLRLIKIIPFPATAKLKDVVAVMEAYKKTEVSNENKWRWNFCKSDSCGSNKVQNKVAIKNYLGMYK